MPFGNLSGDPAQDYLADGISEDVIVELGRFRDLNVLSRQSTSVYRGKAVDVREIGRALGAGFVLEGTVRQLGDRLRITGRLIDAASGTQVWSEAFNETLTALDRLYALRPGLKIADIVWVYRRFQRPDADSAKYVEAFREAGIPEGRYRPLDIDGGDP